MPDTLSEVIKTHWVNPRRKRFWVIIAVLFYTLFGFFAAPLIVEKLAIDFVQEDLGRTAVIEKVEVNPYVMSLRVQGFELDDSDGVRLAAFDEFFINFQLSSLFNWALTFDEIRLAGSYFFFERFDLQSSRLSKLLEDLPKDQEAETSTEEGGVPRLLIHNLTLSEGRVDVKDNVPEMVVETSLAPINISIQALNTLPDRGGKQTVTIRLPGDATLKWSGSLTLAPLDSEGDLELKNLQLDKMIAYLEGVLPLETIAINLSSRFHYRIHMDRDGQLDAEIDEMEVDLIDIAFTGLAPETDFLSVEKITLSGGTMRYPEQSLNFSSLHIDKPGLTAWLGENGKLSLEQLIPASTQEATPTKPNKEASPWQLGLGELRIEDGHLILSDQSIQPAAMVDVSSLQFKLSEISNQNNVLFPLELSLSLPDGGSFNVDGSLGVFPELSFAGRSQTKNVPLSLAQAYVQQSVRIMLEAGVLDSDIEINMPAGQALTAAGAIQVIGLEINDSIANERLLGWDKLDIDHFEMDAGTGKLHLSQMLFEKLFGRMVIHEDQSTNLSKLVIEQDQNEDTAEKPTGIIIGGIRVDNGSMDFSDFSLPLPFATHIANLNGAISTIDTDSDAPANIMLEGQVDEYGLARIEGVMNLLDPIQKTDVTVEFRNLLMSSLSPYTVQFAGHEIAGGKMGLELKYVISDGMLHGENSVVMSDLVLGEKVEHPDAASLPLGLAVALLKDANGVISIDLPIEGDINDPEFRIGSVVGTAIAGVITKIVSAPFRLLGNLIGIDSEDLGQFEFLAGRSDLTPPELEKVVQLKDALQKRPELAVEISGVTDPAVDTPALKLIHLRALAIERLGKKQEIGDRNNESMLLDVEMRGVVVALFTERNPDTPLEGIKAEYMNPPAGNTEGKPVLDGLAYATDLWERLLASEVISEQDLTDLAKARATAISTAFLASGEFDKSRVVIAEPQEVESEDGKWVRLELGVGSD